MPSPEVICAKTFSFGLRTISTSSNPKHRLQRKVRVRRRTMKKTKRRTRLKCLAVSAAFLLSAAPAGIVQAAEQSGSWRESADGWWYRYSDGTYAQNTWLQIKGKWYYFLDSGYMATSQYRDGRWINSEGVWVTKNTGGRWKKDSKGWWYTDDTGWYPVEQWLCIDGKYYFFNEKGYLVTNEWIGYSYVNKNGEWVEGKEPTLKEAVEIAEKEYNKAVAAAKDAEERRALGSVGFINYMLAKKDLTKEQRTDLEAAKKILDEAMEEDFSKWWGGDSVDFGPDRNGKVVATGDRYDAISLDNYEAMFSTLRTVNKVRLEDDLFTGKMARQEAKTNFYLMAVAQAGADRGAGLGRHSSLRVSCENLAFSGGAVYLWASEKGAFLTAMEELGMKKLSSEEDLKKVIDQAETVDRKTVGHYTNLFWAADQVMGVGFTNHNGTTCYNASAASNYKENYALYTIDEFEKLYQEYYSTINTEKHEKNVANKKKKLEAARNAYYASCTGHEYGATKTIQPTCTEEGYDLQICKHCGYSKKTNIKPATGHSFKEGVCTSCGLKTVKKITGVDWRLGNYTDTTKDVEFEVGSEIEITIHAETANDYIYGDEYDVIISDPSILSYTRERSFKGKMKFLKAGLCTVTFVSKENPDARYEVEVDSYDKGGHTYSIGEAGQGDETTTATCTKCGAKREVKVPTDLKKPMISNEGTGWSYIQNRTYMTSGNHYYYKVEREGYQYYTFTSENNDVILESSDESVVEIAKTKDLSDVYASKSQYKDELIAKKPGVATITAYLKYRPEVKSTFTVYVRAVNNIDISEISLDQTELEFDVDDRQPVKLTATCLPSNATLKIYTFSSSNETVATVDEDGTVTPLGVGKATITAKPMDNGKGTAGKCSVTVWGKQDKPSISVTDFTTTESSIKSTLTGSYEYRMKKDDGTWTEWTTNGSWRSLKSEQAYTIEVRTRKNSSVCRKESDPVSVSVTTDVHEHIPYTLIGKPATCTEDGLTDGEACASCGAIIKAQEVIPAIGHTIVEDPAVEPTTESTGLTRGTHCAVCGAILEAQQVVPKLEKEETGKTDDGQEETGKTDDGQKETGKTDDSQTETGKADDSQTETGKTTEKTEEKKQTLTWKHNSKGWWVEDEKGWYPTSQWMKINGKWYYFKADGYMASQEWCEGYWLSKNGTWSYRHTGRWNKDKKGFWYEDTSGWRSTSEWIRIDGYWYYANAQGYMVTGPTSVNGKIYIFDQNGRWIK